MKLPRHPAVRTFLVLTCLSLLAGGCTARQSQSQYEERLERALAVRTEVSAKLDAGKLASPADYAAAEQQLVSAVDELDADPPPSNAEDAHASMVAGLEGMAALMGRLGRCEALAKVSAQDRRACRASIDQTVYDEIRNDLSEANTIYRAEGYSLAGLGGDDEAGDSLAEDPKGGDEL